MRTGIQGADLFVRDVTNLDHEPTDLERARQRIRDRAADGVATADQVVIPPANRGSFSKPVGYVGLSAADRRAKARANLRAKRAAAGDPTPVK